MGYRDPRIKPKPPKVTPPSIELKRLLGRFNLRLSAIEQVDAQANRSLECTVLDSAGHAVTDTYALTLKSAGHVDLLDGEELGPWRDKVIQGLLLDLKTWVLAKQDSSNL